MLEAKSTTPSGCRSPSTGQRSAPPSSTSPVLRRRRLRRGGRDHVHDAGGEPLPGLTAGRGLFRRATSSALVGSRGSFPALSQAKRSLGRLFAQRTPRPKARIQSLHARGTTPPFSSSSSEWDSGSLYKSSAGNLFTRKEGPGLRLSPRARPRGGEGQRLPQRRNSRSPGRGRLRRAGGGCHREHDPRPKGPRSPRCAERDTVGKRRTRASGATSTYRDVGKTVVFENGIVTSIR